METRWVISVYIGHHTKNKCELKLTSFTSNVNATCLSKGLPLKERLVKSIVRTIHTGTTNQLGYYLAGLIEGDGSIIVPKTIRNQKGKLLYPIVKITFVEKDKPLALKIKEVIGGGTIVEYNNSSYIELLFQDVKSIRLPEVFACCSITMKIIIKYWKLLF